MIKKIIGILLVCIMVFGLIGCGEKKVERDSDKIYIVTTLFPQYDFAKQVGGDNVDVSLLLPTGVEPHSFEPTPKDIVNIQNADIFIYTGDYMEPWVARILSSIDTEKVLIIDASKGIELLDDQHHHEEDCCDNHHEDEHHHEEDCCEHHHEDEHHHEEDCCDNHHEDEHHHEEGCCDHHHEDEDEHGEKDPHIWLDPNLAMIMVDNIVKGLVKVDPENKMFYKENGHDYNEKLKELDGIYEEVLSKTKSKKIIYGGHFAFGYLANRYGLEHISPYVGFAPNAEPTPQRIAELIKNIRDTGLNTIFYEELVDPKIARVISEETGAKMVLLHAAHNISKQEIESNVTYIDIMLENLEKLKEGLGYGEE